ncbi:MAG: lipoyl synthase [Melioribacteraceae bacterium]|nr:lipoyl synthase [Melioribacteraceae bacterium]MCF8264331.1 lipoyl synthase [Melioribacteraceae bacterium]MCF8412010.1 lipoyl synthase [Melioribacteraceae bacterium]MCF8431457.1 lipoyl synthase [Melioribacteraceae bacterium]
MKRSINKFQLKYGAEAEKKRGDLGKRPDWLKVRLPSGKNYTDVLELMRKSKLNTVCEEARCPNLAECWNSRTATFMILGDTCTRSCGFCNVKVGLPTELDWEEPKRVAESVLQLNLRHVVITSVNRDELEDGGAAIFSETVKLIRQSSPDCTIEILIPDFKGEIHAFEKIMENPPDILNHNMETVDRLYFAVRPQAKYQRSLDLIRWFKNKNLRTKSGIMVGIGEKPDEVVKLMKDLHDHGCDIMTIGQYLQPTKNHLPVDRYVTLEEFKMFKDEGLKMGMLAVESGPLVRSSYHADKHARTLEKAS